MAEGHRQLLFAWLARRSRLRAGEETGQSWELGLRPPRAAPRVVAVTVTGTPAAGGGVPELRWLFRDITARRRAEEELRLEKEFNESLINAAQVAVLVADAEGVVVRTNPFLLTASGLAAAEVLGLLAGLLTDLSAAAEVVEAIDDQKLQALREWPLLNWRYELIP
jgi:PAS domain-containing protein